MHVKEVIVEVLEQVPADRDSLLVMVMSNEPRRPISLDHFQDCLKQLEKANRIESDGRTIRLVPVPETKTA